MGLSSGAVGAVIPVTDMARSTAFYEGTLGLTGGHDHPDGGRSYPCAAGTSLRLVPAPAAAGRSSAAGAAWVVDDLAAVLEELSERGVPVSGDGRVAFVVDPDGNLLSLHDRRLDAEAPTRPRDRGMLAISATLTFPPGRAPAGMAAFRAAACPTRAEPGCLEFGAFACPEDPDRLFVFEVWASRAALARHFQTDHVAVLGSELARLGVRSDATTGYDVSASRRLTEA